MEKSDNLNIDFKKRADILISLLIRLLAQKEQKGLQTLQEQITFLSSFGLKSKEIADILGKTDSHIRKELTLMRKK